MNKNYLTVSYICLVRSKKYLVESSKHFLGVKLLELDSANPTKIQLDQPKKLLITWLTKVLVNSAIEFVLCNERWFF